MASQTVPTVTQLTNDQVAKLAEWRDRWLTIGLSTDPSDRDGARRGIIAAYAAAGLKEPAVFVWLRSPLEGVIGAAVTGEFLKLLVSKQSHSVRQQVRQQVEQQVGQGVEQRVGGEVGDEVGGEVGQELVKQVGRQVGRQVGQQVWRQVEQQ